MYAVAFGRSPFEHRTQGFLKLALLGGDVKFPQGMRNRDAEFSGNACSIMKKMLIADPKKRTKLSKLLRQLEKLGE